MVSRPNDRWQFLFRGLAVPRALKEKEKTFVYVTAEPGRLLAPRFDPDNMDLRQTRVAHHSIVFAHRDGVNVLVDEQSAGPIEPLRGNVHTLELIAGARIASLPAVPPPECDRWGPILTPRHQFFFMPYASLGPDKLPILLSNLGNAKHLILSSAFYVPVLCSSAQAPAIHKKIGFLNTPPEPFLPFVATPDERRAAIKLYRATNG